MVSVLTVSKRTGWEEIAQESLARQTYQDFEWIVVSENPLTIPMIPAPEKTRQSNLNASLNKGIANCSGDYIIFYQDFIVLPDDCFEKLIGLADRNTFVTTLSENAPGKEDDPRAVVGEPPKPCPPEYWEANVGIAPTGIVKYLGGFDEDYDNGWSWDNVNLACRAALLGCNFLIDPTNNPQLLEHEKPGTGIDRLNGQFHHDRMHAIEHGDYPLRVDYLTSK